MRGAARAAVPLVLFSNGIVEQAARLAENPGMGVAFRGCDDGGALTGPMPDRLTERNR